jgi:broad specificity phosphatase PhoE
MAAPGERVLYLLRHGETEWSRERRKQGRGDSPLTELGVRQARACGLALRSEIADRSEVIIHVSPLGRARATAEIVRICLDLSADRVVVEDWLAEHDYGAWQGLIDAEIDQRYPGARAARAFDKWNYVIPGGESYAILKLRLETRLARLQKAETAIVIAHDMVSRVLRGIHLGLAHGRLLALTHPHTRIYRLTDGAVSELEAPLASSWPA